MLSVRELTHNDIELISKYWYGNTDEYLIGMGVDVSKMPTENAFKLNISTQLDLPYSDKSSYPLVWTVDNIPFGHCNASNIVFSNSAFMHLHIWESANRLRGFGVKCVIDSLPYFFNNLALKTLYCEPYALNPSPNKTLPLVGFRLEKTYNTSPGNISFEQLVNRWVLTRTNWMELFPVNDG